MPSQEVRQRSNKKTSKGAKKAAEAAPPPKPVDPRYVRFATFYHLAHYLPYPLLLTMDATHTHRTTRDMLTDAGTFSFSFNSAFRLFLVARCTSAIFSVIQDCDEVYNYWEPMHYLQYGYGMQTWEYSPKFGIRSWAYILPHAIAGWFSSFLATNKASEATYAPGGARPISITLLYP